MLTCVSQSLSFKNHNFPVPFDLQLIRNLEIKLAKTLLQQSKCDNLRDAWGCFFCTFLTCTKVVLKKILHRLYLYENTLIKGTTILIEWCQNMTGSRVSGVAFLHKSLGQIKQETLGFHLPSKKLWQAFPPTHTHFLTFRFSKYIVSCIPKPDMTHSSKCLTFHVRPSSNEEFNTSSEIHLRHTNTRRVSALTREEVPVAVGFTLALLTVGHGRHLLGRGAAHLLLLSCSPPPHPWALQAHLGQVWRSDNTCVDQVLWAPSRDRLRSQTGLLMVVLSGKIV